MTRRMPADWEPHRATVMLFCDAESVYDEDDWIRYIRKDQARLARTIARYEKVILLVSARNEKLAEKTFGPDIDIRVLDHCDMWARDALTTQVIGDDGKLIGIDWNFNIWGKPEKLQEDLADRINDYNADIGIARAGAQLLGFGAETAAIVTEGGAIDSDGEGTILTTESTLLHKNRNGDKTKDRIEDELKRCTGAKKIIWLPGSYCVDDITGGHVDGIARFVAPGHMLLEVADKSNLTDEEKNNQKAVDGVRDAKGRPISVTLIESPRKDKMPRRGSMFAGLYINFAFANGAIILPEFGDKERDHDARRILSALHPNSKIEQISINNICEAGGGIHCVTQSIPT